VISSGLEQLSAAMAARVERRELPGIVTLVAHSDEVWVNAIGFKAYDSAEPMQRETPFRIASMTKPVLAAATMLLVEDGLLRLSDAVEEYLPELRHRRVLRRIDGPLDDTVPARRPITVEDLLTFRMGMGHLYEPTYDPPFPIVSRANELQLVLGAPDPRTPHPPDEWIRLFATLPLMYQPGERWQYNAGSLVLGVLVARAAGQDLDTVFRTRIFEPLGMHHTGFWLPLEITRQLPAYYMSASQRSDVSTPEEWSKPPVFPSGAGGLLSTADDYLRFARMLLAGGEPLLSSRSVELMTTNHLTDAERSTGDPFLGGQGWGYGMSVVTEPDDAWPVPGRYGWAGGYGTDWLNDPHRGIVAIALTQVSEFLWNGGMAEFARLVAAC
jgi:CubicO group peptidase (beta-lactamase class C family)